MSTSFENTLDDILRVSSAALARHNNDRNASIAETMLPLDVEVDAIERAKAGDEDSLITLLYAYGPALAAGIQAHRRRLGEDEARSVAVLGLIEAIQVFDPSFGTGLAGIVAFHITAALTSVSASPVSVTRWAEQTFLMLVKKHKDDYEAAAADAPNYRMSSMLFREIRQMRSTHGTGSSWVESDAQAEQLAVLEGGNPIWGASADVETVVMTEILCRAAFSAVNATERDVIQYVYGFSTGEPMSDGAAAYAISLRDLGQEAVDENQSSISRAAAQRHHQKGLAKMRKALSDGRDAE